MDLLSAAGGPDPLLLVEKVLDLALALARAISALGDDAPPERWLRARALEMLKGGTGRTADAALATRLRAMSVELTKAATGGKVEIAHPFIAELRGGVKALAAVGRLDAAQDVAAILTRAAESAESPTSPAPRP